MPAFHRRKFVSVTLAFSMAVMLLTAIGIVIANISDMETLHTFTTTAHVLSGVLLFGFVPAHLKLNWNAMKRCFTRRKTAATMNSSQPAEPNAMNTFRRRRTISLVLIISSLIMLASAYAIQLVEDNIIRSTPVFDAIHVLSGLVFTGFIMAHLKLNWKPMKSCFVPKKAFMSKEVLAGFCISMIPIVLALALVIWNPVSH